MEFDFEKAGALETLDDVPEHFRGVYVQGDDGKYVINETLKGVTEAVSGLNKALRTERQQHGQLKSQKDVASAVKEALGDLGITSLEEAKAKFQELTTTLAEKGKVDPAKIRQEIEQTFKQEREGYEGKLGKMQSTLDKYLIENSAMAELAAAKGNAALLLPHIKSQVKVVPDGDEYVVRVLDADGQYRGDGKGGFMTVGDLVKELKGHRDYAVAFASETPSGGGNPSRTQRPSREAQRQQSSREDAADRNPVDLISAGLSKRRGGR